MSWIKIRTIRKEAVFTVTAGEVFNLESKTGKRFWNDPKFLISVPKYESTRGQVDTRVKINLQTYPNFTVLASDTSNNGKMVVDVYVVEGDEDWSFNYGNSWSNVANLSVEKNKYIQKLNKSNNFTMNVPHNVTGNYKILYMFNTARFDKTMFAYDISHSRNQNSFKINITSKNAIVHTGSVSNRTFSVNNPIFISCSFISFGNISVSDKDILIYLYENGVRKQCKGHTHYMWTTYDIITQLESYVYHAKNDSKITIEYRGETNYGNIEKMDSRITYSYATKDKYNTVNVEDFEITALIVWGI